ncbi:MAG: phosphoribosylanthranilate isomerase [Treponema sp.]|jgi:phosphoribosylanthranilate isomerase|nr:phosphoribosylanthranilate isomerase [Treponema sp.]
MAKIKICGLFREEDIEAANEAKPDFIGFVFAPSRRRVSAENALRLRRRLSPDIIPAGVFVNAPVAEAAALYRKGIIALVQLHGSEDGAYIAALKDACGAPVIKAVRVETGDDLAFWKALAPEAGTPSAAEQYRPELRGAPDYLLFDQGGGTGKCFDWGLLEKFQGFGGFNAPCFLAGGIDSNNIAEALSLKPYGIDVSSGAETGGIKDREKMIRLVRRVRAEE